MVIWRVYERDEVAAVFEMKCDITHFGHIAFLARRIVTEVETLPEMKPVTQVIIVAVEMNVQHKTAQL